MRVAITTWRRPLPTFMDPSTDLYTLGAEYAQAVADGGATPLLLGHLRDRDVDEVLSVCDALVLSGGGDVDPASYGAADTGASHDVCPGADASEIALVRGARQRHMPVLGICRGMQILNVACGGTLKQEVGGDSAFHPPVSKDPDEVKAAAHPLVIEPDTRLAAVYGRFERDVNTIHHQAVDRVAPGFRVTAQAPDGIVEAIEHTGTWLALGVQWHPEKSLDDDAPLFSTFVRWVGELQSEGGV
jgi:putative glutamine amidotransferase